ncbi:GNAT family N-acetyltransferase [Flammeovirga yaeyamensis]|uniref:GNAT family N-acetyltransferase n=1 Tax=Flammeovirga yaeyamensis TaxID=367791 RepID=A0AAX1N5L1_9BACT|nr:GNAT family N-acetyltransferase [Flammeovirga yaeyamensis]MBB3698146.1 GNAT superfamily N-acetyltransferase [Flammeovirga yaeyamensis]NMF34497.1 GNAT family N-acetyltransferase [Flammeovirga yaeyamensis]QWG01475.1 GNAT family N-acetyltransferase [Flammeovirga yaeyamensis]
MEPKTEIDYTISLCDVSEIDRIAPLWKKLYAYHHTMRHHTVHEPTDADWNRRKTKLRDKACDMIVLIAVSENQPVGYLVASLQKLEPTCGEVDSLFVREDLRSDGIGGALLEEALNWFNYKGVIRKKLAVGIENERVLRFYERYGFKAKRVILEG